MTLQKLLESQEKKLIKTTGTIEKLSIINLIIQLKYKIYGEQCINELYRDVKLYFEYCVFSVKERIYGYDYIDLQKTEKMLSYFDSEKKYTLCNYLANIFYQGGFDREAVWAKTESRKAEIGFLFKRGWGVNGNLKNFIKLLLSVSSINLFTMVLTLVFLVIVMFLVTFPFPISLVELFYVKNHYYFDNPFINHLSNVISGFVGVDNDFEIVPLNFFAFSLMIFSILFKYIIVINFLIREIEKRVKL